MLYGFPIQGRIYFPAVRGQHIGAMPKSPSWMQIVIADTDEDVIRFDVVRKDSPEVNVTSIITFKRSDGI